MIAAACSGVACDDSLELPTPPSAERTDELLAIYEAPTGTVDPGALEAVASAVIVQLSARELRTWSELVTDGLAGLRQRLEESSMPTDPGAPEDDDRAKLQAVVTLTRTCGDRAAPPEPGANGSVSVTALVEDGVLSRQIWGRASACRTYSRRGEAEGEPLGAPLDAVLLVYLYEGLPTSLPEASFLLRFGAALEVDGERVAGELDLRVVDGRLEYRQAVADGDIVAGVDVDALSLRARNGTFSCRLDTLECQ